MCEPAGSLIPPNTAITLYIDVTAAELATGEASGTTQQAAVAVTITATTSAAGSTLYMYNATYNLPDRGDSRWTTGVPYTIPVDVSSYNNGTYVVNLSYRTSGNLLNVDVPSLTTTFLVYR